MTLATYLINLDRSVSRLEAATRQLRAAGIDFTRVPAFDGRELDPAQVADYDHQATMRYVGRPLRGAEIGCYYSHLDCARRFLESGADHALVLEDDMQLAPGAMETLAAMLRWLAQNRVEWDIINIGAPGLKYTSPLTEIASHSLVRAHYFPQTTTGIVWSRSGAQAFVEEHRKISTSVDQFLREWQTLVDRGLSVTPPLVSHTGVESDIDGGGAGNRRRGRSLFYGPIKQRRILRNKLRAIRHMLRARRQAGSSPAR